ncbi:hypothetical protein [Saccharopolyspora shandongensis]|nr:hypothetical protein [Saccharopolyspora shandongensis]
MILVRLDEVMGDSAGKGRAAASSSDVDQDRQTELAALQESLMRAGSSGDAAGRRVLDGKGDPAGERMGASGKGQAGAVPAGIATLAEVAGRMEQHLNTMPLEFNPNGVREYVETLKQLVRQGQWTPTELQTVESRLGVIQEMERKLHNVRRAKGG